ncbi:hypothetical protein [Halochromatium sp.]
MTRVIDEERLFEEPPIYRIYWCPAVETARGLMISDQESVSP